MKKQKNKRKGTRVVDVCFKLYTVLVYLFLFSPIVIVIYMSFNKGQTNRFPVQEYSLQWYKVLFQNNGIWASLRISLVIAVLATLSVLIIGTFAAYAIVRYKFKFKSAFISLMLAPMLIPSVITGISMLLYFSFIGIKTSVFTVILGHSVLTLPYATMIITARLQGLHISLEEAARNLGANEWNVFFKIVFPQIKPGLLSAALFAFTISLDEFALTFFVNSPSSQTLPIRIYSMLKFGLTPELNALSTIILVLSFGLIGIRMISQSKTERVTKGTD